jgi:hypothetical protein
VVSVSAEFTPAEPTNVSKKAGAGFSAPQSSDVAIGSAPGSSSTAMSTPGRRCWKTWRQSSPRAITAPDTAERRAVRYAQPVRPGAALRRPVDERLAHVEEDGPDGNFRLRRRTSPQRGGTSALRL